MRGDVADLDVRAPDDVGVPVALRRRSAGSFRWWVGEAGSSDPLMSCIPWQSTHLAASVCPPFRATPWTPCRYFACAVSWHVPQLTGASLSGCGKSLRVARSCVAVDARHRAVLRLVERLLVDEDRGAVGAFGVLVAVARQAVVVRRRLRRIRSALAAAARPASRTVATKRGTGYAEWESAPSAGFYFLRSEPMSGAVGRPRRPCQDLVGRSFMPGLRAPDAVRHDGRGCTSEERPFTCSWPRRRAKRLRAIRYNCAHLEVSPGCSPLAKRRNRESRDFADARHVASAGDYRQNRPTASRRNATASVGMSAREEPPRSRSFSHAHSRHTNTSSTGPSVPGGWADRSASTCCRPA